jgi:hypothetical protein
VPTAVSTIRNTNHDEVCAYAPRLSPIAAIQRSVAPCQRLSLSTDDEYATQTIPISDTAMAKAKVRLTSVLDHPDTWASMVVIQ